MVEVGTDGLSVARLLGDPSVAEELRRNWRESGGLLVLRGLTEITPEQLIEVSRLFGEVEGEGIAGRANNQVIPNNGAVLRIGNTRDGRTGELNAGFINAGLLPPSGSPQYRPEDKRPIWHTDSTFRARPPIGSLLFCKQAPADGGGATCFADTRAAYTALGEPTKARLDGLECVCSLAHHDAKIHTYTPTYPLLTPEERLASPANRVPMVLRHPRTGQPALYGMNSSTCAVVPKGQPVPQERLDAFELEAVEDPSVEKEWRSLLPFVTQDRFTVTWRWRPGDAVVWDNRCTMHCPTGFDDNNCTREMWRTTLVQDRA